MILKVRLSVKITLEASSITAPFGKSHVLANSHATCKTQRNIWVWFLY